MTRMVLLLTVLILNQATAEASRNESRTGVAAAGIRWEKCAYRTAASSVRCGRMQVPESYNRPHAKTISLPFVVFSSTNPGSSEDSPVVYFNGGPGASAMAALGTLASIRHIRENRELIVMEHRGAPASDPALICEDTPEMIQRCYAEATEAGIELEEYNNSNSARDFEELRKALGVERWNLFGVSYGTTLAMYYMRAYPDVVRSVVLDSPTAPNTDIARADVTSQLDGLTRMFLICASDSKCRGRYGALRVTFLQQFWSLSREPFELGSEALQARYGNDLDAREFVLGVAGGLQSASRMLTMPAFIDAVAERNEPRIVSILEVDMHPLPKTVGYELPTSARGLNLSIYCGEIHYSRYELGPEETIEEWPKELIGVMTPGYYRHCVNNRWPIQPVDRTLLSTVVSELPTLFFLGAMDPITSAREADRAREGLKNSRLLVVPATTHGVVRTRECAQRIMATFLEKPSANPKASCIEDIPRVTFRTDL